MNTCHHQIKFDICAIVSNCGQMSRAAFVQVKPCAQPTLDICYHELRYTCIGGEGGMAGITASSSVGLK